MSGKVVDNVVKMEWDADKALYTKGGKFGRTFIFAGQEYSTPNGTITVFFNCHTAFLWADDAGTEDEDLYNAKELKSWVKDNLDGTFPYNYSNYIPIVDYDEDEPIDSMIEKYGLQDFVEDIMERLRDVKPYSEEHTAEF